LGRKLHDFHAKLARVFLQDRFAELFMAIHALAKLQPAQPAFSLDLVSAAVARVKAACAAKVDYRQLAVDLFVQCAPAPDRDFLTARVTSSPALVAPLSDVLKKDMDCFIAVLLKLVEKFEEAATWYLAA
jgi:hypothetical protein